MNRNFMDTYYEVITPSTLNKYNKSLIVFTLVTFIACLSVQIVNYMHWDTVIMKLQAAPLIFFLQTVEIKSEISIRKKICC